MRPPGRTGTPSGGLHAATPADSVSPAERLLDAAAAAFADRGFHGTTTRDIAARAGLSPAGVYVHFPSKESVLYALSRRGHEAALELVRDALADPGSPSQRVARLMSAFAAWHADHYEVARVVQHESPHLSPEHRADVLALRRRIDRAVRSVVVEGVATGEFVVEDVADAALALTSLCVDVARWYQPSGQRTPEMIGRTYATLGLRLLGAPAGGGQHASGQVVSPAGRARQRPLRAAGPGSTGTPVA